MAAEGLEGVDEDEEGFLDSVLEEEKPGGSGKEDCLEARGGVVERARAHEGGGGGGVGIVRVGG